MLNPSKKYNLEYYLGVVDKIVAMGAHILGVKVRKCKSNVTTEILS
jgi:pyruvate carboxylase